MKHFPFNVQRRRGLGFLTCKVSPLLSRNSKYDGLITLFTVLNEHRHTCYTCKQTEQWRRVDREKEEGGGIDTHLFIFSFQISTNSKENVDLLVQLVQKAQEVSLVYLVQEVFQALWGRME